MAQAIVRSQTDHLTLVRPSAALFPSYGTFIEEMRAAGETIWPTRVPAPGEDESAFVKRLLALETCAEPPLVPQTVFWACLNDGVVGLIVLRHELTDKLAQYGGNVSYEVRPSVRRCGVATKMVRLILATERARHMRRLLITCAPNNIGSRRAIEANGGVLKEIVFATELKRETCHYWIDVCGDDLAAPEPHARRPQRFSSHHRAATNAISDEVDHSAMTLHDERET